MGCAPLPECRRASFDPQVTQGHVVPSHIGHVIDLGITDGQRLSASNPQIHMPP